MSTQKSEHYIRAKVQPGAKKESLRQIKEDVFEISVREEAEHNAANDRIRELLARHFKVPARSVLIHRGNHRRNKILRVLL